MNVGVSSRFNHKRISFSGGPLLVIEDLPLLNNTLIVALIVPLVKESWVGLLNEQLRVKL